MAVLDQVMTDRYMIYNGDSAEVLAAIPNESIGLSVYSPPFATENGGCLYNYSSSVRDLSNARTYNEFFEHYAYIVEHIVRATMPGRISAVHCMDVPKQGSNICGYTDFPGDIIRLHEKLGMEYLPRIGIWKEPLSVRLRTMAKALSHRQICEDATLTNIAAADYLLPFRKRGVNPQPVTHPNGLMKYSGEREVPKALHRYRGWTGKQTENRFSQWIWRHYASCFWDDIRVSRVLPYLESKDTDDERHQHPLQLDVIERCVDMWSNPNDIVLTPFMGVGSEVFGAVINGRRGVGCELKPSYFKQAVKNMKSAESYGENSERSLFQDEPDVPEEDDLDTDLSDPVDEEISMELAEEADD